MNHLRRAERALREDGVPVAEIDTLVGPGYLLVEDRTFWEHQRDGLVYYATPEWSTWLRVPIALPELVAVGRRLVVGPLLELLVDGATFWVLALSQRRVRLFEATRFAFAEPIADRLPDNAMALARAGAGRARPDAFAAGGVRAGGTVFFGRGERPERSRSAEIARYFREVDAVLRARVDGAKPPPLLLAGDTALLAAYRKVSRYPALLEVSLPGNSVERTPESLIASARLRLDARLRVDESAAAAEYRRRKGTGLTATEPDAVLDAALQGWVATLLLSTAAFWPGASAAEPLLRLAAEPVTVADRLDRAAAACMAHAGTVHAVSPERMPSAGPSAAVLRF
ncbi:MAG: hypothetical protein ACRDNS_09775 [Trebonia sp.]